MEQKILAYLKEHEAEIFEDLKTLVLAEASTSDIDALAKVREKLVTLIKERTGEDCFVYEAENGHFPVRTGKAKRRSCSSVITIQSI